MSVAPATEGPTETPPESETTRWYAYVLVSLAPPGTARSPLTERRRLELPREVQALAAEVVRTYVGVAVDVERRARQHNGELPGGARSTRVGRPWRVAMVHGPYPDRGSAQSVEYQLKQRRGAAARLRPLDR